MRRGILLLASLALFVGLPHFASAQLVPGSGGTSVTGEVRVGITRLVNPDQFYTERFLGIDLQRYMVRYLSQIPNVTVVHRRLADQLLLNEAVGDVDRIYDPRMIGAANGFMDVDLVFLGSYSVDPETQRATFEYRLADTRTMTLSNLTRVITRVEHPIPGFNAMVRAVAGDLDGRFAGVTVEIPEAIREAMDFNSSFTLTAYTQFSGIMDLIRAADYREALKQLQILEIDGLNLRRIYDEMAYCYEQLRHYDDMFESYLRRFEITQDIRVDEVIEVAPGQGQRSRTFRELVALRQEIGRNFALGKLYEDAIQQYELAVAMAEANLDAPMLVMDLKVDIASARAEQGLMAEAMEILDEVVEEAEAAGARLTQLRAAILHVQVLTEQGQIASALDTGETALVLAVELGDAPHTVDLHNRLAAAYLADSDSKRAFELTKTAVDVSEAMGDQQRLFDSLIANGHVFEFAGQLQLAMDVYERAYNIADRIADVDRLSLSAYHVGHVGRELCQCQFPEISAVVDNNLHVPLVYDELLEDYISFRNSAVLKEVEQQFDLALRYYTAASTLSERTKYVYRQIDDMSRTAMAYIQIRDLDRAFEFNRNALDLARSLQDHVVSAEKYADLGMILGARGDDRPAVTAYEQAIEIADQGGLRVFKMHTLRALADRYLSLNDMGNFQASMAEAVEIATALGVPEAQLYQQFLNANS